MRVSYIPRIHFPLRRSKIAEKQKLKGVTVILMATPFFLLGGNIV